MLLVKIEMLTNNKNYLLYLIFFLYLSIFGTILYLSDGIPFIFDNNESFSAWWHAYNSKNFGFFNSYGLADESFSYDLEAHPFPRLSKFQESDYKVTRRKSLHASQLTLD